MRILIVDDDIEVIETLKVFFKSLADENYEIISAIDGKSGLEKFDTEKPDVVFLDIRLPYMSGLEVLSEIKKMSPAAKVVIITSYREITDIIDAFRKGAFDCLLKPFDFNYIKNTLLPKLRS